MIKEKNLKSIMFSPQEHKKEEQTNLKQAQKEIIKRKLKLNENGNRKKIEKINKALVLQTDQ